MPRPGLPPIASTGSSRSLRLKGEAAPQEIGRWTEANVTTGRRREAAATGICARSSNRGYDCARRRTTTTPRVTRENRPATTEHYKTISGRGAAEVAEYGSDPGGDPTDRHRRGWLASPDERKLQNNFDTGAGESRGDGVETTAPLTASGWAGAARLSARGRGRRPTLPLYRTA